jgi:acyl-homoserine-lactone acylase
MSNADPRRRRSLAALTTISAVLAIAGCGGGGIDPVDPKPLPNPTTAAEIRRTSFGIPHIIANDEKGLGYGIGFAYGQDNFCVLATRSSPSTASAAVTSDRTPRTSTAPTTCAATSTSS